MHKSLQHRGRRRCAAVMERMRVDVDEDPTFAHDSSCDGSREESPVHRRERRHNKFVDDEAEVSGEEG